MTMKAKIHAEQEANDKGATAAAVTQTLAAQVAPQPQAKAGIATDAAGAAAGAALVSAPATPQAPDEHHGKGGLYQMIGGQRVLVAQTRAPD